MQSGLSALVLSLALVLALVLSLVPALALALAFTVAVARHSRESGRLFHGRMSGHPVTLPSTLLLTLFAKSKKDEIPAFAGMTKELTHRVGSVKVSRICESQRPWIPAFAGMTKIFTWALDLAFVFASAVARHSREGGPVFHGRMSGHPVTLPSTLLLTLFAKSKKDEIPAFAGMTEELTHRHGSVKVSRIGERQRPWIPAFAGMTTSVVAA